MLPHLQLVYRYGLVEVDLYRGAYPKGRNYRFLKRLQLKTILSLIPEQPVPELVGFCLENSINNVWIRISKPKENVPLSYSKILRCLQVLIQPDHFPIYVHCLDGTVVTGIVIACLRKLQRYAIPSILNEYLRFSGEEAATSEESEFVENFSISTVQMPNILPIWLNVLPPAIIATIQPSPNPNNIIQTNNNQNLEWVQDNLNINGTSPKPVEIGDISMMVQALALEGYRT